MFYFRRYTVKCHEWENQQHACSSIYREGTCIHKHTCYVVIIHHIERINFAILMTLHVEMRTRRDMIHPGKRQKAIYQWEHLTGKSPAHGCFISDQQDWDWTQKPTSAGGVLLPGKVSWNEATLRWRATCLTILCIEANVYRYQHVDIYV